MLFSYPDIKLQKVSRYYLQFHKQKLIHNLFSLSRLPTEYLTVISPFSFDDVRYTLYPNLGWIEEDYNQMLSLDLNDPEDKKIFRLLAANLARVIVYDSKILQKFKTFPHFEQILEFTIIEGLYEYFNIDVETLLLKCLEQKIIRSGDCALLTMSKQLIFKEWYSQLNLIQKLHFKSIQFIFKIYN